MTQERRFEYAADISGGPRLFDETMYGLARQVHDHVMKGARGFVILGAMSCRVTPAGLPVYAGRVHSWTEVALDALAALAARDREEAVRADA